jgi:hypothetical protein
LSHFTPLSAASKEKAIFPGRECCLRVAALNLKGIFLPKSETGVQQHGLPLRDCEQHMKIGEVVSDINCASSNFSYTIIFLKYNL